MQWCFEMLRGQLRRDVSDARRISHYTSWNYSNEIRIIVHDSTSNRYKRFLPNLKITINQFNRLFSLWLNVFPNTSFWSCFLFPICSLFDWWMALLTCRSWIVQKFQCWKVAAVIRNALKVYSAPSERNANVQRPDIIIFALPFTCNFACHLYVIWLLSFM